MQNQSMQKEYRSSFIQLFYGLCKVQGRITKTIFNQISISPKKVSLFLHCHLQELDIYSAVYLYICMIWLSRNLCKLLSRTLWIKFSKIWILILKTHLKFSRRTAWRQYLLLSTLFIAANRSI